MILYVKPALCDSDILSHLRQVQTMASVPISSKILLDAMLEKVGLPAATYLARPTEGTRLEVTVTFYPIKIKLGRSPVKVSLSTSQH